jgi:hypothetical protein
MPLTLAEHFALIEEENRASLTAPLSARKAMLVVVLLDQFADRVFATHRAQAPEKVFFAEDVLGYRDAVGDRSPALAAIFSLCRARPEGPVLKVVAVEVPIADYPQLPVEDYMVSLYNKNTVQRVVIASPDGTHTLAHGVLGEAVRWWQATGYA